MSVTLINTFTKRIDWNTRKGSRQWIKISFLSFFACVKNKQLRTSDDCNETLKQLNIFVHSTLTVKIGYIFYCIHNTLFTLVCYNTLPNHSLKMLHGYSLLLRFTEPYKTLSWKMSYILMKYKQHSILTFFLTRY